jgi:hypothetical protein
MVVAIGVEQRKEEITFLILREAALTGEPDAEDT